MNPNSSPAMIPLRTGKNPKKLFRDMDAAILGGVASGIGKYFNIDANFVRVAFFLMTFLSGFGIILYLFLWLILPEAKSSADKLLMSGEPVNIATLQHYRESVQDSLGKGPRLLQRLIVKTVRLLFIVFTALISLMILCGLGIFSVLFYMYPFRPIVSGYSIDYLLLGLTWLVCVAFIGLLITLAVRILGYKSSRVSISALILSVIFIIAVAGTSTSGLLVYNHFSNKYGDDKDMKSLALTNQTSTITPTTLRINSDSNLDLTYVISNQSIHADYEYYPGMNQPNLTIINDKGTLTVNSAQLDQAAPSCLGDICKNIYLPVRVFLYGPAPKQVLDSNGASLTINDSDLGSSISFDANNESNININNSYATQISISASNNSYVSANNTTAQNTVVTIDSTSGVTVPITNSLTANIPTICSQDQDSPAPPLAPVLSLPTYPQRTLINGHKETTFALNQNSCVNNNY